MFAKSSALIFFLMLRFIPVQAQPVHQDNLAQMSMIGGPKKLDFEIVTQKDANGRFCAAIKVVSDMDGFRYDAYNGVVDMKDNPGEDMVYLQPDERVLEIYHAGYEPLKIILMEVGIQLHPKDVWQVKIKGAPKAAQLLPVSILIKPAGARLSIDGKLMQGTPPYQLSKGAHTILVKKENFKSYEKTIHVDEKNVLFNIALKEREDILVAIETNPPEAEIYIDGLLFGTSPLSKFYREGNYAIEIKKEGYITLKDVIEIKSPSTKKLYKLTENVGYLQVNTNPSAKVYLDDKEFPANKEIKVTPRVARIRVTMPKAIPMEKQVAIKKNDHVQVDLYPYFPKGTILVAVTPFDAKITLQGDAGEYFNADGSKKFKDIPTGIYKLTVSKSGYKSHQETIQLAENDKAERTVKLQQGYSRPTYSSTKKTTSGKRRSSTYAGKRRTHKNSSYFGFQVGAGFANYRKLQDVKVDANAGVQYGMFYNGNLSGLFSFQVEMNIFERKMTLVYVINVPDGTRSDYTFNSSIRIIQIPLLLKANFSSFSLYAGPSYNYFGTAEAKHDGQTTKTEIKKWELSYAMGLAFHVGSMIIDARYDYGSKFLEKDSPESKRSDLFVLLGYHF